MIPFNILILLFMFMMLYMIGLLMSLVVVIMSIKDRNIPVLIISLIVLIIFSAFGLSLL